jgi:hypothetical protein
MAYVTARAPSPGVEMQRIFCTDGEKLYAGVLTGTGLGAYRRRCIVDDDRGVANEETGSFTIIKQKAGIV